jgi:MFS family permease
MSRSPVRSTLLGAGLGLAWGTGLRGWMAVLAGEASHFTWSGTFAGVLLPATLVGAALGWAEHKRRGSDTNRRRWTALAPLLFVLAPALVQADFVAQLRTGLGTGAIGVALIGMLGGYAIGGRGPRWAVLLARILMAALVTATVAGAFLAAAEPRQAATAPSGAYLALAFLAFCGLLAWACAIPHLPTAFPSRGA